VSSAIINQELQRSLRFTSAKMRFLSSFVSSLLLSGATIASAASSWSFEDATVSVNSKGAEVGAGLKDK
jgi:oligosaccharyltransferase complex subunit delta (ribophorin II)